jgi:RNA polymerase sigma-70 factor, ECF subfamily
VDGLPQELEERLRTGDREALAGWFDEHRDELRRFLVARMDRRLAPRIDASDIVQQAYLDADTRLPHYADQPEGMPFDVWVRQVALQSLFDLHRKHVGAQRRTVKQEVRFSPKAGNSSAPGLSQLPGRASSPSNALNQGERRERLDRALAQLSETDREILELRHFEQLGNREVAERLDIAVSAASNRYVRALRRLAHVLSESEGTM